MNERCVGLLGATSLLGACLQQRLIQDGWQITAFSRHQVIQNHANVTWKQLRTNPQTEFNTEQKKITSWLCVAPIWTLTEHFNLLLAQGAQRIIVLSSTSRFTKDTSTDKGEQAIAHRLAESEETLQKWAMNNGIEWVILRPTLIYGRGGDKNITEIARFIGRFGFFPLLGPANGLRQPIHVEDVAAACLAALVTSSCVANRAYNLTGGETLDYHAMIIRVFIALNRSPRLFTVPRWFFQLTIIALRWLPRYRHWTTAMAERMNQDLVFDCSDAKQDLNFSPRPFKLTEKDLPTNI